MSKEKAIQLINEGVSIIESLPLHKADRLEQSDFAFFNRAFPPNFSLKEMVEGSRNAQLPTIIAEKDLFWKELTLQAASNLCILAWNLQTNVRDKLNIDILVTNAWRPSVYEVRKKRRPDGTHPQGLAADVTCRNNNALFNLVKDDWNGGFGRYSWGAHLDIHVKRRW
jgi:hypothetical protein